MAFRESAGQSGRDDRALIPSGTPGAETAAFVLPVNRAPVMGSDAASFAMRRTIHQKGARSVPVNYPALRARGETKASGFRNECAECRIARVEKRNEGFGPANRMYGSRETFPFGSCNKNPQIMMTCGARHQRQDEGCPARPAGQWEDEFDFFEQDDGAGRKAAEANAGAGRAALVPQ